MTDMAPLVGSDVDLSKLDGFMLDTVRLLGSELAALSTGDEFKAAVLLWCWAWRQVPHCSLPDDDRVLASFARVPAARWKKIKPMALRGFVKCSDGRLYHKVLSQDGQRAWEALTKRRERTQAATEARKRERDAQRNDQRNDAGNEHRNDERDVEQTGNATLSHRRDGTGRDDSKKDSEATASGAAAPSLEAEVFRRGKLILGAKAGGQITKIRKIYPGDDQKVLALFDAAETKQDPAEWLNAIAQRGSAPVDDFGRPIARAYDASEDYRRMGVDV